MGVPVIDSFTMAPNPAVVEQVAVFQAAAHDPDAKEVEAVLTVRDIDGDIATGTLIGTVSDPLTFELEIRDAATQEVLASFPPSSIPRFEWTPQES